MTRVACLVVNYFSAPSVGALLASFSRVELPQDLLVAIVDNSCDDAEWRALQEVADAASPTLKIETVRSETNLGYAAGNNRAFDAAGAFDPEVVFVINPDVTFDAGSLRAAGDRVAARPDCAFGASTRHGGDRLSGLGELNVWTGAAHELAGRSAADRRFAHPMGHFLGLGTDSWRALGGLSEDFFLFCEELDLALRLRGTGGCVDSLDEIVIDHEKGLTTGAVRDPRQKSLLAYRHATRSRVVLYRRHRELGKYLPPMIAARLLWSLGLLIRSGPGPAQAVLAGLRDGIVWKPAPR
jgi:N-acetylglucosaminyl-diphospho-decaprenol L-rhamnosyltransferase